MNIDRTMRNDGVNRQHRPMLGASATNNSNVPAPAFVMPGRLSLDLNIAARNHSATSAMNDLKIGGAVGGGGSVDKLVLKVAPSDGKFAKPVLDGVGPKKNKAAAAAAAAEASLELDKLAAPAKAEKIENADDDEETSEWRKKQRLEQNKLSARRSRKRKKIILDELQMTVDNLNAEYKVLEEENRVLTAELERRRKMAKVEEAKEKLLLQQQQQTTTSDPQGKVDQTPKAHGSSMGAAERLAAAALSSHRAKMSASHKIAATNAAPKLSNTMEQKIMTPTTDTPRPSDIMTVRTPIKAATANKLDKLAGPFAFAHPRPATSGAGAAAQDNAAAMNFGFNHMQQQQRQQQQQPTNRMELLQRQIMAAVASQRLAGGQTYHS